MDETAKDYSCEIKCVYDGETYSVRDNGAVMRHERDDCRDRILDNIWTFGKPDKNSGYLIIGSARVHRIVATAFHGDAPSSQHVVDHINTNKHDNRPENLRWVTKLENIVLNPITCKKLEWLTGKSIDYILKNIEILHDIKLPQDISWMRNVTREEGRNCYENLLFWAKNDDIKPLEKRGTIGEWIYQKRFLAECNKDNHLIYTMSENAVHDKNHMHLQSEYPCCPLGCHNHSLEEYMKNLISGAVFFKTKYAESIVEDAIIYNDNIIVRTKSITESIKPWCVCKITLIDNVFVHELIKTCFEEVGALKYFTEASGGEWAGGEVMDDGC